MSSPKRLLMDLVVLLSALVMSGAVARAQVNFIPVFQYAVFYNDLLEFSTCADMTINGRVHSNTRIYTGTSSTLTFNSTVTTCGSITCPFNNGSGPWAFPGGVFNGSPQYVTNVPTVPLSLNMANTHSFIEMPVTNDANTYSGSLRLFNQAEIILLVSNNVVTVRVQAEPALGLLPGMDPSPLVFTCSNDSSALATNFPFLTTTNTFLDQREDKTVKVTQIDVGRYANWVATNDPISGFSGKYPSFLGWGPTILYVADLRSVVSTQMVAVRLTNGAAPPKNGGIGFTVGTPNPLYVQGNYNQTNAALLYTTNTSSGTVPCALISDALTILSSSWRDTNSFIVSQTGPTAAAQDIVNAAIITGIVPSTGTNAGQFSGGVHNLPRLLENWVNSTLWLNTSLVNLYSSTMATNKFVTPGTGSYYQPPTRKFSYDQNFNDPSRVPPGTPVYIQILNPLGITNEPQGITVIAGQGASFSVGVTNLYQVFYPYTYFFMTPSPPRPFTYQWYFNTNTLLAGATNATLSSPNVQAGDAGTYDVVVTWSNSIEVVSNPFVFYSNSVVTSSVAPLTVLIPPKITGMIPLSQSVPTGTNVTIQVVASGTAPLSYQWSFSGSNIPGATNATLVINNVQTNQSGIYSVYVTNVTGASYAFTGFSGLTVTQAPPAIPPEPVSIQSVTAVPGTTVAVPVEVVAGGNESAIGFSLVYNTNLLALDPATNVVLGNGAAGALLFVNTSQTNNGQLGLAVGYMGTSAFAPGTQEVARIYFDVLVVPAASNLTASIAFGDQPVQRQIADVTASNLPAGYADGVVSLMPYIITALADQTLGMGSNASFQVAAAGTWPLGYQWQRNGTNISGATNGTLVLANVQRGQGGGYAVVVSNGFGSVTSSVATLVVNRPQAAAMVGFQPRISGATISTMTLTGVPNGVYVLQFATDFVAGPWINFATDTAGANGLWTEIDGTATNAVRFYRCVLP